MSGARMNSEFYATIIIVLITRLYYLKKEKQENPISFAESAIMALIQCIAIGLTFITFVHFIGGLSIIILLALGQYLVERNWIAGSKNVKMANSKKIVIQFRLNLIRIIVLIMYIILLGVWANSRTDVPLLKNFLYDVLNYTILSVPIKKIGMSKILPGLMGLLLIINEINIIFRLIFDLFSISHPGKDGSGIGDEEGLKEYNYGRLIGILERIIIYFLVLLNKYEAIGLVMAAKAFARFKEMDDRQFAEYVLIGTLLSVVLAVGMTLFIKLLM